MRIPRKWGSEPDEFKTFAGTGLVGNGYTLWFEGEPLTVSPTVWPLTALKCFIIQISHE